VAFHEDWFEKSQCRGLAERYRRIRRLRGAVIEVGCWEGRSTIAIAKACAPEPCHAVDNWTGSLTEPGHPSVAICQQRDVFADFLENVQAAGVTNIMPHRMDWRDFFATWRGPIKFFHLDGAHDYRSVRDNLAVVRPLMIPGGLLCGDDIHAPSVRAAVGKILGPVTDTDGRFYCWPVPSEKDAAPGALPSTQSRAPMHVRWIGGELSVHGQLRYDGRVYDFDERTGTELCVRGLAVAADEDDDDVVPEAPAAAPLIDEDKE